MENNLTPDEVFQDIISEAAVSAAGRINYWKQMIEATQKKMSAETDSKYIEVYKNKIAEYKAKIEEIEKEKNKEDKSKGVGLKGKFHSTRLAHESVDDVITESGDEIEGDVAEENLGAMIPQVGMDGTAAEDAEEDIIISLSESVLHYVNIPESLYTTEVSESVRDIAINIKTKTDISREIRKTVSEIALLEKKIENAKAEDVQRIKIMQMQKDLINKKKYLRELQKGSTAEEKSEVNKIFIAVKKALKKDNENKGKKVVKESVEESVEVEEPIKVESTEESVDNMTDELSYTYENAETEVTVLKGQIVEAKAMYESTSDPRYSNMVVGLSYKLEKAEKVLEEVEKLVATEAANMEDEIKPIVKKLEDKGYMVKYASPGHHKLRRKEDQEPDGVYHGKLYSDARIMFEEDYKFSDSKCPKYWHWRIVDGCSYLDITPLTYKEEDGTPNECFAKWKVNYMNALRSFVDDLDSKDSNKEIKESVECGDLYYEMVEDIMLSLGGDS